MLAGLVIPSLLLDEPGVAEPWHSTSVALNWLIWTAFLIELVVLLAVAPRRWSYLRHHPLDLVIVVLTPPFLAGALNGVRLLRLVGVARLPRLKPLVAWLFRSGGLKYAALFTALVVVAATEAFSIEENTSYFTALYWAITTVTTVGYGNPRPTTTGDHGNDRDGRRHRLLRGPRRGTRQSVHRRARRRDRRSRTGDPHRG